MLTAAEVFTQLSACGSSKWNHVIDMVHLSYLKAKGSLVVVDVY